MAARQMFALHVASSIAEAVLSTQVGGSGRRLALLAAVVVDVVDAAAAAAG